MNPSPDNLTCANPARSITDASCFHDAHFLGADQSNQSFPEPPASRREKRWQICQDEFRPSLAFTALLLSLIRVAEHFLSGHPLPEFGDGLHPMNPKCQWYEA